MSDRRTAVSEVPDKHDIVSNVHLHAGSERHVDRRVGNGHDPNQVDDWSCNDNRRFENPGRDRIRQIGNNVVCILAEILVLVDYRWIKHVVMETCQKQTRTYGLLFYSV